MIEIVQALPPVYDRIVAAIGKPSETAIYTYGDTIYSPRTPELPPDIFEHEAEHVRQQEKTGAEAWWSVYLVDRDFRLEQELAAYRTQWRTVKQLVKDRNAQTRHLFQMAQSLAGPLYGRIVGFQDAMRLIKS